jgi:arginine repressor
MNLFLGGRPDRQHVQALITSKQVGHLERLFQNVLSEVKTSLVRADDMALIHRLQGRAQVLEDFLEALEQAPSVMERLK